MKKILYWGDAPAPLVWTGFGVVAKYILKALHNTGEYEIDVLGVNYFGSFYDKQEVPYQVSPARLLNPQDPFGKEMLFKALAEKQYDILFVLNDVYITWDIVEDLKKIKADFNPNLKVVYYYPIDCILRPEVSHLIKYADQAVAYTEHGKKETLKVCPELTNSLEVIYHGVDTSIYHPLSKEERTEIRQKCFNVIDSSVPIFINVNRNSIRKDLAKTVFSFIELRKREKYKDAILYLHTVPREPAGLDLLTLLKQFNLSIKKDVIFPANFNYINAFPPETLNQLYNAADVYITTTLGEGFGLTVLEAMAAGTLVVAPNNTSLTELVNDRGYLYPCKELSYVDSSGARPMGRIEDITRTIDAAYTFPIKDIKIKDARLFAERYSWENVCKEWVTLFNRVVNRSKQISVEII